MSTRPRTAPVTIASLAATALILAACGSNTDAEESVEVTLGLTYTPDVQFAPVYVAEQQGYFDDSGAEVTVRHHGANEGLFTAAETGEEDLVIAGGAEMMQAVSEGADLQYVATFYQDFPVAIVTPADSEITTLEDLAGHTVGVPGEFGETWFALQVVLEELGEAADDVTVETIGFTQVAALTSGHVDAVVGHINNDAVQLEAAGVPANVITIPDVPLVSAGLIATDDMVENHPETVEAVAEALQQGLTDIVADPQLALDASEGHVPDLDATDPDSVPAQVVDATVPLYGQGEEIGTVNEAVWHEMNEFMVDHDLSQRMVDVEEIIAGLALQP